MSFGVTLFPPEQIGGTLTNLGLKKITAEAELALTEAKGKRQAALGIVDSKRVFKNRVCAYVRDKSAVISKTSLLTRPPASRRGETPGSPLFYLDCASAGRTAVTGFSEPWT